MNLTSLIFLIAGAATTLSLVPDAPVVRRHDRPDERYLELGKEYGSSLCTVGNAAGTLVGDRWILTAGHVAANISPFSRSAQCNGASIPIADVYTYPGWGVKKDDRGDIIDLSIPDLAMIRLARAPNAMAPMRLSRDTTEPGLRIVVVGMGLTGTGETGPEIEDGKLRAATNVIDSIFSQYFTFTFSPPDDPTATDLEGIGGPGDSGGPAIVRRDGRDYVVGVSSLNQRGPGGSVRYNSTEVYARVSTNAAWIDSVISGRGKANVVADTVRNLEKEGWPAGVQAAAVKGWVDSFNSQDSVAIVEFNRKFRTEAALKSTPPEQRVKSSRGLFEQWGPVTMHRYVATPGKPFLLLVHSEKLDRWMSVSFSFEGERGEKLGRTSIRAPEDPPM